MGLTQTAFRIRQKDTNIYVTTMRASELLKNYTIEWWRRDNPDGYQRPLRDSRIRQIKHFLSKESGTFPTSVLANVRGDIQVKTLKNLDGGMELCEITVPDESLPLEIIDGQHRVEGLKSMVEKDKKFEGYPVIVSLFTFHDKYDEMLQFHIVNSRAKRVPTDLAQRHIFQMASTIGLPEIMMREGERKAFGAYVIPVVDALNKDPKSVWHKKVQLPDQPRKETGQVIRQRPLADSIHYIVKNKTALRRDLDKLTKHLKDYWSALSKIFPIAFSDPANYTIQATTGTYSLHMVFPDVYEECEKLGDLSEDGMEKVLKDMFEKTGEMLRVQVNDDFWSKEIGTGHFLAQATSMKMIKALAEYFREALWEK